MNDLIQNRLLKSLVCCIYFCYSLILTFRLKINEKVNNATARVQNTNATNSPSTLNGVIKGGVRKDNKMGVVSPAAARLYTAADLGDSSHFSSFFLYNLLCQLRKLETFI